MFEPDTMATVSKTPTDMEQPELTIDEQVMASRGLADGDVQGDVSPMSWRNWVNLSAYIINTIVTYTSLTGIFGATNTELSKKYQTLVTPAGWAFSIWGPIFIWEGIFVVAQLMPRFRCSEVVSKMSCWWWALCSCQVAWTLAFAQDQVSLSLVFMLSILASLLGLSYSTDGLKLATAEYFLLRAPMSLQLGWIIAASIVNINVQADAARSSQEALLAVAVISNAAVIGVVTYFTFAVCSPDPIVGFVAAWAFAAIYSALGDPADLNDPARFNASVWDPVVLGGLRNAALGVSLLAVTLALFAAISRVWGVCRNTKSDR